HLLKVEPKQDLFDHLYIGSPLAAYRKRLEKEFHLEPSESYRLGASADRVLDIATGDGRGIESPGHGKMVHQLVGALVKDFYRPRRLGQLFSDLYPNEYFNPFSSPVRLHRLIQRAREWLASERLRAEILIES